MILKVSKFLTKFLLSQQLYGKALKLLFKQLEEKPNSQTNEKIILNVIIDFIFIEILLINAFNASFYNINNLLREKYNAQSKKWGHYGKKHANSLMECKLNRTFSVFFICYLEKEKMDKLFITFSICAQALTSILRFRKKKKL